MDRESSGEDDDFEKLMKELIVNLHANYQAKHGILKSSCRCASVWQDLSAILMRYIIEKAGTHLRTSHRGKAVFVTPATAVFPMHMIEASQDLAGSLCLASLGLLRHSYSLLRSFIESLCWVLLLSPATLTDRVEGKRVLDELRRNNLCPTPKAKERFEILARCIRRQNIPESLALKVLNDLRQKKYELNKYVHGSSHQRWQSFYPGTDENATPEDNLAILRSVLEGSYVPSFHTGRLRNYATLFSDIIGDAILLLTHFLFVLFVRVPEYLETLSKLPEETKHRATLLQWVRSYKADSGLQEIAEKWEMVLWRI